MIYYAKMEKFEDFVRWDKYLYFNLIFHYDLQKEYS
jgi:hypothetical protein